MSKQEDNPQADENQQSLPSPKEIALQLASWGKKVFPCHEFTVYKTKADGTAEADGNGKPIVLYKEKAPYIRNGFCGASSNPIIISSWWTKWPGALIGLPTGTVNDITVVDLDPDPEAGILLQTSSQDPGCSTRLPGRDHTKGGPAHILSRYARD